MKINSVPVINPIVDVEKPRDGEPEPHRSVRATADEGSHARSRISGRERITEHRRASRAKPYTTASHRAGALYRPTLREENIQRSRGRHFSTSQTYGKRDRMHSERDAEPGPSKRTRHDARDDVSSVRRRDHDEYADVQPCVGQSRGETSRHQGEQAEERTTLPGAEERAAFRREFAAARELRRDEVALLQRIKKFIRYNDLGGAIALLDRSAADFLRNSNMFTCYVDALSNLLKDHRPFLEDNGKSTLVLQRWRESAMAFSSMHESIDDISDSDNYVARISHLCNRWGQTQPIQAAGCATIAGAIADLRASDGTAALQRWIGKGTLSLERDLGLLINAFSKWPDDRLCMSGLRALADMIVLNKDQLYVYTTKTLAIIANGLSKTPDGDANLQAMEQVSAALHRRKNQLDDHRQLKPQDLSNIIGGMSKFPDSEACRQAVFDIAAALPAWKKELGNPRQFNLQAISNIVSALGKFPDKERCRNAAACVASALSMRRQEFTVGVFVHQDLMCIINGLSKFSDDRSCRQAVILMADILQESRHGRNSLVEKGQVNELASIINGLSKFPDSNTCQRAIVLIADALTARRRELGDSSRVFPQHLANIVNGLGHFPDNEPCREAITVLVDALSSRRRELNDPQQFIPQHLSSIANGLGKFADCDAVRRGIDVLADALLQRRLELYHPRQFTPRALANTLNGLSKFSDNQACRRVAADIADALIKRRRELDNPEQFKLNELCATINSLSKFPEIDVCQTAATDMAAILLARRKASNDLEQLDSCGLANIVNGLGHFPDNDVCREAVSHIAGELLQRKRELGDPQRFIPQHLANIVHGLSRFPDDKSCRTAIGDVADALSQRKRELRDLRQFAPQELANIVNGLSRFPDDKSCQRAIVHIAAALSENSRSFGRFGYQHLSMLINGLSKFSDYDACHEAVAGMADALAEKKEELSDPRRLDPLSLSTIVNGLSKFPLDESCRRTVSLMAEALLARKEELGDPQQFNARHLSNVTKGLNQFLDDVTCQQAIGEVASALTLRRQELADPGKFKAHELANIVNALSRNNTDKACQEAAIDIIRLLGSGGRPFRDFTMIGLAAVANGMARFALALNDILSKEESQQYPQIQLIHARLRELTAHLDSCRDRLAQAETRQIAMLFKALASLQLKDCLRLIARQGLERIKVIHSQTRFRENDLESLGNLMAGLRPLLCSSDLKKFSKETLRLLERIQPDIARKMQCYIDANLTKSAAGASAPESEPSDETFDTRRPGLTFFLLLKTYHVVAGMWKHRNVLDANEWRSDYVSGEGLWARHKELKAWLGQTMEQVKGVIESDLDESSWNLIAQIEAGERINDTLDLKLRKDYAMITLAHQPTPLDVLAVRRELRGLTAVRDVLGSQVGAAKLQVIDLNGRQIKADSSAGGDDVAAMNYSFFTRLTDGKLPLLEVQLPGKLSAFMLSRIIRHDGDLLRMDMFGGSHIKPSRKGVHDLLSASDNGVRRYGRLPALRVSDTFTEAPLMRDVIRKLNPQREDWFRMQRALVEVVPRNSVVEGPIRLSLLPDRSSGAPLVFPLRTPDNQPIMLEPNDGCGFIRASLACKIPVIREAFEAWHAAPETRTRQQQVLTATPRMSVLPPQATHHFPRDAEAIEEARLHLLRSLREDPTLCPDPVSGALPEIKPQKLYDLLVSANISGIQGIAVPSADNRLHLPNESSQQLPIGDGPLLLGKPPYDKANLMEIGAGRVGTVDNGDATARFLRNTFAFQYSYTAWDESGTSADGDDAPMLHGKGVTIIVPDELWPRDNQGEWVWSTEDMKVHSSWTEGRRRDRLPPLMDTVGSLRVKDVFPPGSLIAVPINELRKRDADCDGDKVYVFTGLPKMAQVITQHLTKVEQRIGKLGSFKPPKTANSASDAVHGYNAGRAAEILSAVRGNDLLGRMSVMQFQFYAQPPALHEQLATRALFGTYEGTERELRRGLQQWLNGQKKTVAQEEDQRYMRLSLGQQAAQRDDGSKTLRQTQDDLLHRARAGVKYARHPLARQVAQLLLEQLEAGIKAQRTGVLTQSDSASTPLPTGVAQQFPQLAQAWESAGNPRERLTALIENYPRAMLPHTGATLSAGQMDDAADLPNGQPGYVPGAPLESLSNLLTLGAKVGTDAPKAVTQTDLFLKVADRLERVLYNEPNRIRIVPYTKGSIVHELREGDINAEANLQRLRENPTMTAGIMEMALETLIQEGRITGVPAQQDGPAQTQAQLAHFARLLHQQAIADEPRMTAIIKKAIQGVGELRGHEHRIKSEGSLREKLEKLMLYDQLAVKKAVAAVNDALRYSVILEQDEFAQGYARIMDALDRQGLLKTLVHNGFTSSQKTYKGINVKLMEQGADGRVVRLEVQFHTGQSFELKEHHHNDYKDLFAMRRAGASVEELTARIMPLKQAFRQVPTPVGCEHIEDWEFEPMLRVVKSAAAGVSSPAAPMRKLMNDASRIERQINPILEDLQLNIVKEHSVAKKAKSLREKIHRLSVLNHLTEEQAAARVRDAIRWVVLLPNDTFGHDAERALRGIEAHGMKIMRINNAFMTMGRSYAGLNVNLRTPEGMDFELQFHTKESLRNKNVTHDLYRRWQNDEVALRLTDDLQRREQLQRANDVLFEELKHAAAAVPTPTGVEMLPSFNHYQEL
ncbi:hypothetical protein BIY29_00895 [Brenneria alni]|uniref:Type III effector protein n=1 Tax=Brenneria alni TaxID=71656 RepID=A0A421DU13_9GAMM|nr:XopAD/skwp family type III secretion system effector [Brenneria alni]RLM28245.1 hypothetical protein BIY29_00895 [Brenneria alni]